MALRSIQIVIIGLSSVWCGSALAQEQETSDSKPTLNTREDGMGGAIVPWTRSLGLRGAFGFLATKTIRDELELIEKQMEEIGALAEKYKERNAAVTRERLRRFPNKKILGNRAAYQQMIEWRKEEVNKFGPSTKRQLVLILLPHQNRRLSQIVCRDQGLKILLMKEVQEHLEFTDDQKKQFESILAGFYRPGPGQPGLRLPPDEKDENDNRMRRECLAIMTADQKEKLKVNILGE